MGGQCVGVGEAEAPAAAGDDGGLAGEIDAGHGRVPSRRGALRGALREVHCEIEGKNNNCRRQ
ncbi:hypothetical protein GCM10018780_02200 [Streptomyces lanatus]|nr:hypothetical protein GCM10018780_02200 [Streptomyces lanatus]